MDLGLRGKVALVTGASAGIGAALALALAREGARVAVAARRRERVDDVATRAVAAGALDAAGFSYDQTDSESVRTLVADVTSRLGAVEVLVVNGGGPKPGTFTQVTLADWDAAYAQILKSALLLIDGVLPAMRARRWGRIVALTSVAVKQPIGQLVLSNAYRTALVAALKTLSSEIAREGITVNAIATGSVMTERLLQLYAGEGGVEGATRRASAGVPIGRPATPEEFVPLVAFLCGEPASYVTGQTIAIDGGAILGTFG